MSLKNNPSRDNRKGLEERLEANQEKTCEIRYCSAQRKGFRKYCSLHDSRENNYGDPHQSPISARKELKPYYMATLTYIQNKDNDSIRKALELSNKLIKNPQLIKDYDMSSKESWADNLNDYRQRGFPVRQLAIDVLRRWKQNTRSAEHFLASVIAPQVMTYQEPERLFSGKPTHILITRSLMTQCHNLYEWKEEKPLQFNKQYKPNYMSSRDLFNIGHRLTIMFIQVIIEATKMIPEVLTYEDTINQEKLEYYKEITEAAKTNSNITSQDLKRLREHLGLDRL